MDLALDGVEGSLELLLLVFQTFELLSVLVSLFTEPLDFTGQSRDGVCGDGLFLGGLELGINKALVLILDFLVVALDSLVFFFDQTALSEVLIDLVGLLDITLLQVVFLLLKHVDAGVVSHSVVFEFTVLLLELGLVILQHLNLRVELCVLVGGGALLLLSELDDHVLVLVLLLVLGVRDLEVFDFALFSEVLLFLGFKFGDQVGLLLVDFQKLGIEAVSTVLSALLGFLKGQNELFLVAEFILHVVLGEDELLDGIVLREVETGTEFDSLVELGNLRSQVTDDLAGLLFLFFGGLDQAPGLVDFLLEETDGR